MFNLTAKNMFKLQGRTPYIATFGTQGNIFNICQFNWYEWVYFRDVSAQFPSMKEVLGRYLGSAKNEGNAMMMWVPKANDIVVPRTGLRHITPVEQHGSIEKEKQCAYAKAIRAKLGTSIALLPTLVKINEK